MSLRIQKWSWALRLSVVAVMLVGWRLGAIAPPEDRSTLEIVVTDAESGAPISQAHITLVFSEPGNKLKFKRAKPTSFSAKTNLQGRYKFDDIPRVTVHLMVTADHHKAFGKDFDVDQDHQLLEVKMKKPQPQI